MDFQEKNQDEKNLSLTLFMKMINLNIIIYIKRKSPSGLFILQ